VPVVELSSTALVVTDVVAWGLVSLIVGYSFHRLPAVRLDHDTFLTRLRPFERDGRVYERRLRIARWKDRVPEAGDVFRGGVSKRTITRAGLDRYVLETRRAELTHWGIMAAAPLFLLWNPWTIWLFMVLYAVVANTPCLVIQRYNRARVLRILGRRTA
jgi:glycosyl-4,4'-diaponeurosporenoate acyltransferase